MLSKTANALTYMLSLQFDGAIWDLNERLQGEFFKETKKVLDVKEFRHTS